MARTAVELHGCCAKVSLAAALDLRQHILTACGQGEFSEGAESGSSARSLVLHSVSVTVAISARLGDQL